MPRFFFHISSGSGFIEDEEGIDLPDVATARVEAVKGARDIMAGEMQRGELDLGSFIEVEDEARQLLFTLTFDEAVNVKPRG